MTRPAILTPVESFRRAVENPRSIEQARRATSRSRTVARSVVARVGA